MSKAAFPMTIRNLIKQGEQRLLANGVPNARRNTEWMLGSLVGWAAADLYVHGGRELPAGIVERFVSMIERRASREPLQYILGSTEFMGLEFQAASGVFIPRPDTESLVEIAEEWLRESGLRDGRLLDLCSGSGVIAVSLVARNPGLQAVAVDKAAAAVELTAKNAYHNGVLASVHCVLADALDFLEEHPAAIGGEQGNGDAYDVIVSNPPYVPSTELECLPPEIRHEPVLSLDGGVDGLDFYRAVVPLLRRHVRPGGLAAFEIGADQGLAVKALFRAEGFVDVRITRDYSELDRVVTARAPG